MSFESCICVCNYLQHDLLAAAVKLAMVGVSLLHMTCVQTLPRCAVLDFETRGNSFARAGDMHD